jgi:hypothetical protein
VLVAAQTDALGNAFILRRAAEGRWVTALALDEPGTWAPAAGLKELAAWRSDRAATNCRDGRPQADWSVCGPLTARLTALPAEADGSRRFAVVGVYAEFAGATAALQISVWRWNGRTAEPLLAHTFDQMLDDDVVTAAGKDRLTFHAKAEFRRMMACGACSGRQVETTILLPARGARLGETRALEPDLDLVDAVYDRLFRGQPTVDLAAPRVTAHLADAVRQAAADARAARTAASFGQIMGSTVTSRDGVDTLCLSLDGASDQAQLFTIDARDGRRRIIAVRDIETCGPDAKS